MPALQVFTNVDQAKITPQLVDKSIELVASTLGKPKSFVVASFLPSTMSWGGVPDKMAIVHLTSIGAIDKETNKKTSAALSEFFIKELGLAKDRFYIFFHDVKKEDVGYMGSTIAHLM